MLIRCGGCERKLEVRDNLAGEFGACPACKAVIKMPAVDEVAGRKPGDPPLEARAIPREELERMLPGATIVVEEDSAGASSTDQFATDSADAAAGIETDEDGYVLAVPVQDDEVELTPSPSGETSGGLFGDGADAGYDLKDDDEEYGSSSGVEGGLELGGQGSAAIPAQTGQAGLGMGEGSPGAEVGSTEKIITRCPGCGGRLAIEARFAGKMRTCPGCGTDMTVPLGSTVAAPDTAGAGTPAGQFQPPPDALAEDLADDVDIESYIAEPIAEGGGAIAGYWVVLAFVVGATIGFVAGWFLSGHNARPSQPAIEATPASQVDQGS